jgi:hypothetical protein
MTTIETITTTVERPGAGFKVDDAQLAAVSFLARYSGRTLEAYRHDLRGYFQWASSNDVDVLTPTVRRVPRDDRALPRAALCQDRGFGARARGRRSGEGLPGRGRGARHAAADASGRRRTAATAQQCLTVDPADGAGESYPQ